MNKKQIIKFETRIAKLYEQGRIKAPVHLSGSLNGRQEDFLIWLFKRIKKNDWIFSYHRNHYHWLLSGRNPKELKKQILDKHSMHIYGKRFFTSSIVGGNTSIALGVALALKLKKSKNKVWCFVGDMSGMCGIAKESIRYAEGNDLPITFIIEDNGLSVNTDTKKAWGTQKKNKVLWYKYYRKYPHAGTGQFVLF